MVLLGLLTALRVVGDFVERVVIPWSLYDVFEGVLGFALFYVVAELPWIAFSLAAGMLIDRARHKMLVCATSLLVQAVVVLVVMLALTGGSPSLVLVYALVAAMSFLDMVHEYTVFTFIPRVLQGGEVQRANALIDSVKRGLSLIVPVAVGGLALLYGGYLLALDAALLLAGSAIALYALVRVERGATVEASTRGAVSSSVTASRVDGWLLRLLAAVVVFNVGVAGLSLVVVEVIAGLDGLRELLYGATLAASSVGSLLSSTYIAVRPLPSPVRGVAQGMAVQGLSALVLLGAASTLRGDVHAAVTAALVLGYALASGVGFSMLNVSMSSLLQARVSVEVLGRVRGVFDALATLGCSASRLLVAALVLYGVPLPAVTVCLSGVALAASASAYRLRCAG